MKAITLRNVPQPVQRLIERKAAKEGLSLNKAVIRLLEDATEGGVRRQSSRRFHDLDHLAGTWTDAEADAFNTALAEQRKVDPELWK